MNISAAKTTTMNMIDAICYDQPDEAIFSDREAAHALAADCNMLRCMYQGKTNPNAPTSDLLRATMVGLACRYAPYHQAIKAVLARYHLPLHLNIEALLAYWVSGNKPYDRLAEHVCQVVASYREHFPSCSEWQVSALHHDCNAYCCILPMGLEWSL